MKEFSETSKTSAKISILPGNPPQDIIGLLHALFWKEPELAAYAVDFLFYIKEWQGTSSPYAVDGWESYCTKTGLTQSQYSNMLKRLRRAGMLEKKYNRMRGKHELYLSDGFSNALSSMACVWRDFIRAY